MGIFASKERWDITVPSEVTGGESFTVTCAALSYKSMKNVKSEKSRDQMRSLADMPEKLLEQRPTGGGTRADIEATEAAARARQKQEAEEEPFGPAGEYDLDTLLQASIKAWSLEEDVKPETISDLTPRVADWLGRELLGRNVVKAEEKKD